MKKADLIWGAVVVAVVGLVVYLFQPWMSECISQHGFMSHKFAWVCLK